MTWDINVVAGLVAGVAAMVPGAIIYSPQVLGPKWVKEMGFNQKELEAASHAGPMIKMLLVSLLSGLAGSLLVNTIGARTVLDAVLVMLVAAWFMMSVNLMQVFFERRSWVLYQINVLNHVLTAATVGVVLGLFLK